MTEGTIQFDYQARYFKSGEINSKTKSVWFVLHGYGQLAKYFLQKFSILEKHNICVIAPEGLSRFYLEDVQSRAQTGNNRVGATWMTRENREMDIQNYLNYLDTIYNHELKGVDVPVTIVGFSQGAATASRWAIHTPHQFDRLILWSGIFPPDMNFEQGHKILANRNVIVTSGKSDPFINESRMNEMKDLISKLRITPSIIFFDGGHEIHQPTLEQLV